MIRLNVKSRILKEDVDDIMSMAYPWHLLQGKTVAVSGASGMLAAYVVETLLALENVKVIALVRNVEKAKERFSAHLSNTCLRIVAYDCSTPFVCDESVNYIIHAASMPRPDVRIPVDVLIPNMMGTYFLLEFARRQKSFEQFVFFSSGAVYGDAFGVSSITEDCVSQIVAAEIKNCYSVGKISGEALCAAYHKQYGIKTKMLRFAHTFGPGMDLEKDIRAFAEFLRAALEHKDINLQTAGTQKRCYCYVADATKALFGIVFSGRGGNAYNVVNESEAYSIYEFATSVAKACENSIAVHVASPEVKVAPGYAPLHNAAMMNGAKLRALGWHPDTTLEQSISRTLLAYSAD